jgi:hypothetical protein
LYFARLWRVTQQGHLTRMPRLYLWLNLYGSGLYYYLCQYELEQRLQSYLLDTHFPVISIAKSLIITAFVSYGYILVVRSYTPFTVSRKIDPVMIVLIGLVILLNTVLYEQIPYFRLHLITNVILCFANLCGAIAILPMMRRLTKRPLIEVREAHHAWMVVLMLACGSATLLLLLDSLYKLFTLTTTIYTPLFVMSIACQSLYMIAVAFLIGPDRYLYWAYYPRQFMIYLKLKRLNEQIRHQTQLPPTYAIPMPRIPTLSALEFTNYRLFVLIMDHYRYLPEGSPLSLALKTIDQQATAYEETIQQLQKLV